MSGQRNWGRSWDHLAHLLPAADADHADRFGVECAIGQCKAPPTHWLRWTYVSGGSGRATTRTQRVCSSHAVKFAAKHEIDIGPEKPDGTSALSAAVASVTSTGAISEVRVHLGAAGQWYLERVRPGAFPNSVWMASLTRGDELPAAIAEAEMMLADQHLTPAGPWTSSDDAGSAQVAVIAAHRSDTWIESPWKLRVKMIRPGGMWQLHRCLSDGVFPPLVTDLGDTRMDLARAVDIAGKLLREQRWVVVHDEWSTLADGTGENTGWHPDQADRKLGAIAAHRPTEP